MNEKNNLKYFLNSMKENLPFEDEKDFTNKINESKDFRVKVQKLVYLSKFFGWENSYHFNFHEYGPYSCQLTQDYYRLNDGIDSSSNTTNLKSNIFKNFIKNRGTSFLEATSTILYYFNKTNLEKISKDDVLDVLSYLKPYLSKKVIAESYEKIEEYGLFNYNTLKDQPYHLTKEIVMDQLDGLMSIFENFEVCSNQTLILGSLDYFRLVLKRENLEKEQKNELLRTVYDYGEYIEKYYFINYTLIENFSYHDLTPINLKFDKLQDYISNLGILPRLYDEDIDLNIFLE